MTSAPPDQNRSRLHRERALLASALFAFGLLVGAPTHASEVPIAANAAAEARAETGTERTLAQKVQAAYWRGRTCTTPACKSARPSGLADVASFGLAAFGGVWFSRRRKS